MVVIFRSDNLNYAFDYIKNMFGLLPVNQDKIIYQMPYYIDTIEIITFVAAILCCMPIFKNLLYTKSTVSRALVNIWLLVLFFLSVITIATDTYNPFIYFRF